MKILFAFVLYTLMSSGLYAEQLIIGTSSFNPPMEMLANKNNVFTGFEIDLLDEVCHRINATCIYKPMTFKDIMDSIALGTTDLGIDGFFITQERMQFYLFSQPYLPAYAQLIAMTDSKIDTANINTGKRIGVESATLFKSLIEQKYNNVTIVSYDDQQNMLKDLADHKIDMLMLDAIGASYWVQNTQGSFKLVGPKIPVGIGYGIIANLNKGELISRVNQALQAMEQDGSYSHIYARYF